MKRTAQYLGRQQSYTRFVVRLFGSLVVVFKADCLTGDLGRFAIRKIQTTFYEKAVDNEWCSETWYLSVCMRRSVLIQGYVKKLGATKFYNEKREKAADVSKLNCVRYEMRYCLYNPLDISMILNKTGEQGKTLSKFS